MEQRSEPRFQPNQNQAVTIKIVGLLPKPLIPASIIDLSRTGMRLRSKSPVQCGTSIEIELIDTLAYGSVSRCDSEKGAYILGVQISNMVAATKT